jgi:hypothetical protein
MTTLPLSNRIYGSGPGSCAFDIILQMLVKLTISLAAYGFLLDEYLKFEHNNVTKLCGYLFLIAKITDNILKKFYN